MKKLLFTMAFLLLVSSVFALASCQKQEEPLNIAPPPDTTEYIPLPLNIEFFDEVPYENMSPFNSYTNPTNLPETSAET